MDEKLNTQTAPSAQNMDDNRSQKPWQSRTQTILNTVIGCLRFRKIVTGKRATNVRKMIISSSLAVNAITVIQLLLVCLCICVFVERYKIKARMYNSYHSLMTTLKSPYLVLSSVLIILLLILILLFVSRLLF